MDHLKFRLALHKKDWRLIIMDFNNIIIKSTTDTFSRLFTMNIVSSEIYTVTKKEHNWDISALVGVTGEVSGIISIRMKETLLTELLKKSKITVKNTDNQLASDMLGELVNTIAGNTLSKSVNGKFRISVPIIVRGEKHRLQWPSNKPVIGIPFKFDSNGLDIQYSLQ